MGAARSPARPASVADVRLAAVRRLDQDARRVDARRFARRIAQRRAYAVHAALTDTEQTIVAARLVDDRRTLVAGFSRAARLAGEHPVVCEPARVAGGAVERVRAAGIAVAAASSAARLAASARGQRAGRQRYASEKLCHGVASKLARAAARIHG